VKGRGVSKPFFGRRRRSSWEDEVGVSVNRCHSTTATKKRKRSQLPHESRIKNLHLSFHNNINNNLLLEVKVL